MYSIHAGPGPCWGLNYARVASASRSLQPNSTNQSAAACLSTLQTLTSIDRVNLHNAQMPGAQGVAGRLLEGIAALLLWCQEIEFCMSPGAFLFSSVSTVPLTCN